jgi:hypothetical protein
LRPRAADFSTKVFFNEKSFSIEFSWSTYSLRDSAEILFSSEKVRNIDFSDFRSWPFCCCLATGNGKSAFLYSFIPFKMTAACAFSQHLKTGTSPFDGDGHSKVDVAGEI